MQLFMVQKYLRNHGFYKGPLNGTYTPEVEAAIAALFKSPGYVEGGEPTSVAEDLIYIEHLLYKEAGVFEGSVSMQESPALAEARLAYLRPIVQAKPTASVDVASGPVEEAPVETPVKPAGKGKKR